MKLFLAQPTGLSLFFPLILLPIPLEVGKQGGNKLKGGSKKGCMVLAYELGLKLMLVIKFNDILKNKTKKI